MNARTVVVAFVVLISSAASIYYSINGVMHPELALVYNRANMPRIGIQLLSLLLGAGGVLILLPQTFRLGGSFLIAHSLNTIGCFIATKDWKGGILEFAFLQVPIFMVCCGYPASVLERVRNLHS